MTFHSALFKLIEQVMIRKSLNKHFGKKIITNEFKQDLKSTKSGEHNRKCNLGWCYENGIGIDKNKKKTFKWYMKSAKGGNSIGQNNLGCCYRDGIGTDKDEK